MQLHRPPAPGSTAADTAAGRKCILHLLFLAAGLSAIAAAGAGGQAAMSFALGYAVAFCCRRQSRRGKRQEGVRC
jgi:hypothetical protein